MFLHVSPPLDVGIRVLVAIHVDGRRLVTTARVTHSLNEAEAAALGRRAGIGIELCEPTEPSDQLFAIAVERLVRAGRVAQLAPARHHVVFADSQPALRERIAAAFREAGFSIETAGDGAELLAACARRRPDAVIVEGALPELDGFAAVAQLARDPRFADVPVLLTSPDPADLGPAFDAGAADFVVRPFTAFELIARARRLAAARAPRPADRAILRGDLAGIALPALLTLLEQERKTGRLEIASDHTAWIELAGGHVVGAGSSELAGAPVDPAAIVMSLLDWTRGTFELVEHAPARAADPHAMSITHLLLEHARHRDEARRVHHRRSA